MIVRLLAVSCLLAIALTLLSPGALWAQGGDDAESSWRGRGGPIAFVTHLAADPEAPDFIVVFVAHGVYRNPDRTQATQGALQIAWAPYVSTDGAQTWQPAGNDLAHVQPTRLLITHSGSVRMIWVGTEKHGLWRSTDDARSWQPVIVPNSSGRRVVALALDNRDRLQLLALDNDRYPASYLFTSEDGGANWRQRSVQSYTGRSSSYVSDLVVDPFRPERLYAVTFGGLLLSTDEGFTWREIAMPPADEAATPAETVLVADVTQRGRLYLIERVLDAAGGSQIRLHRSTDAGESWQLFPTTFRATPTQLVALHPLKLRIDPFDPRRLLLAASNGVWLSTDAGGAWALAGDQLAATAVNDVFIDTQKRGRWLAAGTGGVWRTSNAGSQWGAVVNGLPAASSLRDVVIWPQDRQVILALHGGPLLNSAGSQPLWRSGDGGISWMPAMHGLDGVDVQDVVADPLSPTIFAISSSGIAHSQDGGRSWSHKVLPFGPRHLAFGSRGDLLFLSSQQGVWASDDHGATWAPTPLQNRVDALAATARGRLFDVAATEDGTATVWRSSDDGQSWQVAGPTPAGEISHLLVYPGSEDHLILTLKWGGLWESGDGGSTWGRRDAGIPAGIAWIGSSPNIPAGPNIIALLIEPDNPKSWWLSSDGGGVYHSTDDGRTWEPVSVDLGDTLVLSFDMGINGLIAGTSNAGLIERIPQVVVQVLPEQIDARIEIVWPHDFATVAAAKLANMGLRLYKSHSQEVPPCPWTPNVEVLVAQDAQPMRRLGLAEQRTVNGQPFPFWEYNDIDVAWANDPAHKLVFMARVAPGQAESFSSVWVHASDARTFLPQPPEPQGLTPKSPDSLDAWIRIVWPHDASGNYAPPEQADFVNISAVLLARNSLLTPSPDQLPGEVWLMGALDNQVGRRLALGLPRQIPGAPASANDPAFVYTIYEFNNIDVSLARQPAHHWSFWLEAPEYEVLSNVWVHGVDARTLAPDMLEAIAGCQP